jgi:uncharacterized protein (TIGR02600 family)
MKRSLHSQRGIALILVLIFLVLLSVLLFGFFMSVEGEVLSSKTYESDVAVKQLVSSATNIVTSQIVEGTRSTKTRRPPGTADKIGPGERLAWASQPGLIRTWDENGAGWKIFKLYSAPDMVVGFDSGNRYSTAEKLSTEVPNTWAGEPALFVDLNEPALVEDPAGKIDRGTGSKLRASYPIVDPLALAVDKVEGFSITKPPGYGGALQDGLPKIDATTDPTEFVGEDYTANPAPMPASWIYVLKDGTLTVPNSDANAGRIAVWKMMSPAVTPSRVNPIVGRIAFWTDDESCKLNLNTASEPTPWDTPRAVTLQDLNYGKFQPGKREYQRFPGHPAMTALSPVLLPGTEITAPLKEEIYRLIPRIGTGGSMGGTLSLSQAPNPVVLDQDRLFANADELLFEPILDPARSNQRLAVSNDTSNLPALKTVLTPERLRRTRFFLTASSRSPETNLFGQPRVSLWPVDANVARRTPFDRLASFCATTQGATAANTYGYFFQRRDPTSTREDYTGIARNRDLYAYLQGLTGMNVPGFGGNFAQKWDDDRDQVLTEIFDYIRCTNLHDPQLGSTPYAPTGQVTPIIIGDTKGFGRFHTISQFGLHFICNGRYPNPPGGAWMGAGLEPGQVLSLNERKIQAAFIFEPFSPSVGWPLLEENMYFDVAFAGFTITRSSGQQVSLGLPNGGKALNNFVGAGAYGAGQNRGGSAGLRGTIRGLRGVGPGALYPWIGPSIVVDAQPGAVPGDTMRFDGGTATIRVYTGGSNAAANLVQTFTVDFPPGSFPVPELVQTGTTQASNPSGGQSSATGAAYWQTLASRYSGLDQVPYLPGPEYSVSERQWPSDSAGNSSGFKKGSVFRKEDVVRSVVPRHGDIRLIAGLKDVSGQFVPAADDAGLLWTASDFHFAHIFSEPAGTQFSFGFANEPGPAAPGPDLFGSAPGAQLTPANYHYSRLPEIRPGAGLSYNHWGDFDNGVAQTVDGAYINKPDEGNLSGPEGYPYWSSSFTAPTENFFSPNRLVPSAGMLGSLPTGVKRTAAGAATTHAWETLLFRPQAGHFGATNPPDHLIMDLFWMPVIEPYAISEPFSTAGKVNMNYEIAPFSYIHRSTAMVGALKGEQPLAIPTSSIGGSPDGAAKIYKLWDSEVAPEGLLPNVGSADAQIRNDWDAAFKGRAPFDHLRKPIDPVKTLLPFEAKFASGQIFRSATQISEMHLVRQGTLEDGTTPETPEIYASGFFWNNHVVTGDNTRERPYANLYARLTTRSNTFTVHVRAQVLRQIGNRAGANWATWNEDRDQRQSEYRGSTTIERYIDPADPTLADFARDKNAVVDNAYRTRVISVKKFVP